MLECVPLKEIQSCGPWPLCAITCAEQITECRYWDFWRLLVGSTRHTTGSTEGVAHCALHYLPERSNRTPVCPLLPLLGSPQLAYSIAPESKQMGQQFADAVRNIRPCKVDGWVRTSRNWHYWGLRTPQWLCDASCLEEWCHASHSFRKLQESGSDMGRMVAMSHRSVRAGRLFVDFPK